MTAARAPGMFSPRKTARDPPSGESRDGAVEQLGPQPDDGSEPVDHRASRRAREEILDRPTDENRDGEREKKRDRRVSARRDLHACADHQEIRRHGNGNADLLQQHDHKDRENAIGRAERGEVHER